MSLLTGSKRAATIIKHSSSRSLSGEKKKDRGERESKEQKGKREESLQSLLFYMYIEILSQTSTIS